MLTAYEKKMEALAQKPELFEGEIDTARRVRIFEDFYEVSNELGYEADLFVLNGDRKVILKSRPAVPEYLAIRPDVDWGLFESMGQRPGETAVRCV